MCDYSLNAVKTRNAAQGDKLITSNFRGTISNGFADINDREVAVCVLPGTELAFENGMLGRFRQIDTDNKMTHHDAIEWANGVTVKLHEITRGWRATVLQLPAAPRNEQEAKEQKRVEGYV